MKAFGFRHGLVYEIIDIASFEPLWFIAIMNDSFLKRNYRIHFQFHTVNLHKCVYKFQRNKFTTLWPVTFFNMYSKTKIREVFDTPIKFMDMLIFNLSNIWNFQNTENFMSHVIVKMDGAKLNLTPCHTHFSGRYIGHLKMLKYSNWHMILWILLHSKSRC